VDVIEALAGTGKTHTAGVLREVYEKAGHTVIGVAPSARAARGLAEQAGIPSRTLDSRMFGIDHGRDRPAGAVVIFDEAGMASTRQSERLLAHAARVGAEVVAVGDRVICRSNERDLDGRRCHRLAYVSAATGHAPIRTAKILTRPRLVRLRSLSGRPKRSARMVWSSMYLRRLSRSGECGAWVPEGAPGTVTLLGLELDAHTPETLIDHLITESRAGRGGYVVTANLDQLRRVNLSARLMRQARAAEVRVADGMPLLWASRLRGTPLPARVTGSDLIVSLSEAAARSGRSLFLLGGNAGTAEAAAVVLAGRTRGLRIAGTHCPAFGFEEDPRAIARITAALVDAQPDFVYVGLPFAKATELVAGLRAALPATWFLGLGFSFSFVCGDARRAPRWVQRAGLEWLHRLAQEPRRLGRRYLLEGTPFALRLLASSAWARRSGLAKVVPAERD